MRVSSDHERIVPHAPTFRWHYRHGRFTCEAIEMRRQLAAWIREMNQLADNIV
jgi:hypothetical protein